jgi:tetratricopeptide (TPR) repeat protein
MRLRTFGFIAAAVAAFVASSPAHAEPSGGVEYPAACVLASVPPTKSDEAHAFYGAGRALYDEGNYDTAIVQFREAYKRDCSKHDLLVIISRSYELKGDKLEAARALELYLDRVKDSPEASTHRTKIQNLRKQLVAAPVVVRTPPPVVTPLMPPPVVEPVREHTVAPWIVAGVGAAAMVVGGVVVLTTPALPSDCDAASQTCRHIAGESGEAFSDRQSRAGASQNQPTVGAVILGGGAAVLVGGLLWHFLEPTGPVHLSSSLLRHVTPVVARGYVGAGVGAAF